MSLTDIPTAFTALSEGRPIIVVDNESRENEGDLVLAAQFATQEWLAFMIRHTSGFICAPMSHEIADRLELPQGYFERRVPLPAGRYDQIRHRTQDGLLVVSLRKLA